MLPAPEVSGNHKRIDALALPPGALIAAPVELAMMQPTDRNGEAVADLAPHRPRLGKPEVMGIRGGSAADKTGLRRHEPQMLAIALSHRPYDGDGRWGAGIQLSGRLATGFPVLCSGAPQLAELAEPDLER